MIVTCWYRVTEDGLKYNHYSQGFDPDAERPPFMFENQRQAWANAIWCHRRAELIDGVIVNEELR